MECQASGLVPPELPWGGGRREKRREVEPPEGAMVVERTILFFFGEIDFDPISQVAPII